MLSFRGFISIDIGAFPKIKDFANEIKEIGANIKMVELEKIHITLKFLGDTNEEYIDKIEGIIKSSVKDIKPFKIKLKGVGVFPNENYIKVVWIGIQNAENVEIITKNIDEKVSELGFKKENRKFSAHLTVARVKSAQNKERLLQIINKYQDTEFIEFKVESIRLKKSELTQKGPIYTTLKDVKL